MLSELEKFVRNISSILEYDYGDFMRFANVYLNRLSAELKTLGDKDIDQKMAQMKMYIQYVPNWDVELTRKKVMRDSLYLRDILRAHLQDWESDIGAISPEAKGSFASPGVISRREIWF